MDYILKEVHTCLPSANASAVSFIVYVYHYMTLCGGGKGRVLTNAHNYYTCTHTTHNIANIRSRRTFFGGDADDIDARVAGYVVLRVYLPTKGGERACNSYSCSCIEGEMLAVTKSDML